MEVNISDIKVQKNWNVRRNIDLKSLESLKDSIKNNGLMQPIQISEDYRLIHGERRLLGKKELGHKKIEVKILKINFKNFSDGVQKYGKEEIRKKAERLAHLDANLEGKTLNQKETDAAKKERKDCYETLYPETKKGGKGDNQYTETKKSLNDHGSFSHNHSKLKKKKKTFTKDEAERSGRSQRSVQRDIRRADKLTPEVKKAYEKDRVTKRQADLLTEVDIAKQNSILEEAEGLSVAETQRLIRKHNKSKKKNSSYYVKQANKKIELNSWMRELTKNLGLVTTRLEVFFGQDNLLNHCKPDIAEKFSDTLKLHMEILLGYRKQIKKIGEK